jgi:hypothetical protein
MTRLGGVVKEKKGVEALPTIFHGGQRPDSAGRSGDREDGRPEVEGRQWTAGRCHRKEKRVIA